MFLLQLNAYLFRWAVMSGLLCLLCLVAMHICVRWRRRRAIIGLIATSFLFLFFVYSDSAAVAEAEFEAATLASLGSREKHLLRCYAMAGATLLVVVLILFVCIDVSKIAVSLAFRVRVCVCCVLTCARCCSHVAVDEHRWLVLELCARGAIGDARKPLSTGNVACVAHGALHALCALHAAAIVHR